jgi:DNA-binding MarR family transcriptional regulator
MTTMPEGLDPSLADALLLLAADEGQDLNAYARRAGVSNAVMANYLTELSDRARYCEPPGLVIWQPHPLEPRTSQVFLTPKGVLAVKRLQEERGHLKAAGLAAETSVSYRA